MSMDTFLFLLGKRIEKLTNQNQLLTIRTLLNGNKIRRNMCLFLSFCCTLNIADGMMRERASSRQLPKEEVSISSTYEPRKFPFIETNFEESGLGNTAILYSPSTFSNRKFLVAPSFSQTLQLVENFVSLGEGIEEDLSEEPADLVEEVVTNEEKIAIICERYGLTREEFQIIVAVVIAEAKWHSYEDAYAVINTIFNRSISSIWIDEIEKIQGEGTGRSMYHQVIQYHQFDPYWLTGSYKEHLNATPEEEPGMQAVIDFLYGVPVEQENGEVVLVPARLHDYANFVGWCVSHKYKSYSFVERGNEYGVSMKESHYVSGAFTEITEEEIEVRAEEVEQACDEYLVQLEEENQKQLVLSKEEIIS